MNIPIINDLVVHVFIPFLSYSYSLVPNYGVAIIVLTLLVKIVFYPLSKKQFDSMQLNMKLQPEIKSIQEKYKDNPQKAQIEIMGLWKEHGTNPFVGCLPTLVQLPFFFALYATMTSQTFLTMLQQPNINPGFLPAYWLTNLGAHDSFYILPVLIGLLTWWSQKMFITDPKQANLMMFMPILMGFICLRMPSGVLLYWAVSQLISGLQQFIMVKRAT
jgi:YidC/Oxa1 family membrane protein insertase